MKAEFDVKLWLGLVLAFILFTIIGTLSHEMGHYAVAKYLGYKPSINYQSARWSNNSKAYQYLDSVALVYHAELLSGQDFPGRKKFFEISARLWRDADLITLGGPLQTMLTGTFGLALMLSVRRKFFRAERLSWLQWMIVFVTLFWLRQLFNALSMAVSYMSSGEISHRGDEVRIADNLQWHPASVSLATASVAAVVLAVVVFKYVPARQRLTFMAAGLCGGLLGFYLWMDLLGPVLLP